MSQDALDQQRPTPAPFTLSGGDVGVLLIHGFTGSPAEMRPLGRFLHGRGLTVAAPLLPGHGTTPADLNRCRWQDWLACAEIALAELQAQCRAVFVAGLSLGALLTLTLAGQHRDLAGIIAYSPAILVKDRACQACGDSEILTARNRQAGRLLRRPIGAGPYAVLSGLPHRSRT